MIMNDMLEQGKSKVIKTFGDDALEEFKNAFYDTEEWLKRTESYALHKACQHANHLKEVYLDGHPYFFNSLNDFVLSIKNCFNKKELIQDFQNQIPSAKTPVELARIFATISVLMQVHESALSFVEYYNAYIEGERRHLPLELTLSNFQTL